MKDLVQSAVDAAIMGGANYSDARFGEYKIQTIHATGNVLTRLKSSLDCGMGVRVFYNGAWGFAAGEVSGTNDAEMLAHRALQIAKTGVHIGKRRLELVPVKAYSGQWTTSYQEDPFTVPDKEKVELLFEINKQLQSHDCIHEGTSFMRFFKSQIQYANSAGSRLNQTRLLSWVEYLATAVGSGRFARRSFQSSPMGMGYELIRNLPLLEDTKRIADEAKMKLTAKPCNDEKTDLILLPNHTRLIIHETIGHALELDRVLGWEADYAGTSFATPEKINHYQYGSKIFNVTADRNMKHGLATCGFDDDGVPAHSWPLIKNGLLVDYATTRDTAPIIGEQTSHGCAYADHWSAVPILRMANTNINADPNGPSLDELIADTQDGILMDGMDTYSIDHQRINFQFGGNLCKKIRNGKVEEVLHNVVYEGSNPEFWNSVDAICNQSEWRQAALFGCAKGQPVQIAALTHGSSPLRLRQIKLGRVE